MKREPPNRHPSPEELRATQEHHAPRMSLNAYAMSFRAAREGKATHLHAANMHRNAALVHDVLGNADKAAEHEASAQSHLDAAKGLP
jgi:hypothetical protein